MRHRRTATGALIALLACSAATGASSETWVGAWGFPPTSAVATQAAAPNLNYVTVRQLVRIAAPATRLRIRFGNEFGDQAVQLGAVHIAIAGEDGLALPRTDHIVTFAGHGSVAIPANAPLFSDPLDMQLPALTQLAVSVFVPLDTTPQAHRVSLYVSASGDFTDVPRMPAAKLVRTGALVTAVDIVSPVAKRTLVALGDSITEGVGSTVNAFRGWPDRLAERLAANPATRDWSIVNAGIGSNRLLHNNPGKGALARFDRDVLSVPGVAAVLLLEGINDIGYSHTTPAEVVTVDAITGAYQQLIARAHAHGIVIFAGTLPPFEDSHYYDLKGEQLRQQVNAWLRTSGAFDGIVDFDAVMRDAARPTRVQEALHRGDHLHPNDSGYAVMAAAIDLELLSQARNQGAR